MFEIKVNLVYKWEKMYLRIWHIIKKEYESCINLELIYVISFFVDEV
jgi:hypothetical protein